MRDWAGFGCAWGGAGACVRLGAACWGNVKRDKEARRKIRTKALLFQAYPGVGLGMELGWARYVVGRGMVGRGKGLMWLLALY